MSLTALEDRRWVPPLTPVLLALAGGLVLLPVARLAWEVVSPLLAGQTAAALRVLQAPATWRATGNSLAISAGATGVALVVGGFFALAAALTDLRGRAALAFCLILPLMIPPQIVALAWIHLTGSGSPILKPLGLAPPTGTPNPVYSSAGMILVMGIEHTPLVFLALRAALRQVPRDLVEAAQTAGAGRWRILRTIILPLSLPGIASGTALAFVAALGNFGVPALLGIPAGIPVLPTLIYRRLAGFGASVLPEVAVLAVLIGAIACLGIFAQTEFQDRLDSRLLGGSARTAVLPLGRARPWVEALCWGLVALVLAAPLLALAATSLVRAYGLPLNTDTFTLAHYATVLSLEQVGRAFANSLLLSGTAAAAGGVLAFLSAFNELTVSVLLWSQGRETLGVVVYSLEEGGGSTLAAALSVIAIAVVIAALLAAGALGRKLPPGVIPWRD